MSDDDKGDWLAMMPKTFRVLMIVTHPYVSIALVAACAICGLWANGRHRHLTAAAFAVGAISFSIATIASCKVHSEARRVLSRSPGPLPGDRKGDPP